MERKIFLEKNRSRNSVNTSSIISTDIERKTRLMQGGNILGDFSLFEQYNIERDSCNKFRLIFVVNPICSNVLFNINTEVVKDEGSPSPIVLGNRGINKVDINGGNNKIQNSKPITRIQAIRDTEYSHPNNGEFVYHCGTDIFNNHMLRNNGFVHVNKMNSSSKGECAPVYNTLSDFVRDGEGNIVNGAIDQNSVKPTVPLHLYRYDNTLTIKNAFLNKLKEKDGWFGFYNPGNINIETNETDSATTVNLMMANNKPCEFIDMYPDRSLYSFIPKYNKYRDRIEKNWDYCITYPAEKDIDMVDEICGGHGGAMAAQITSGHNSSSVEVINCRSYFKHTLKVGDMISVYYYDGDEFKKYGKKVKVTSIGNYDGSEAERYFAIRANDVSSIYDKLFDGGFYYKKLVGGEECEYYFRIYKKLKNPDGTNLRSDINKLAYAENIYGDREAQIVYTDDINIEGLYDHMGRPVSEIYLTVVKRNAGYNIWYPQGVGIYDENINYGDERIEFSHCFGKLTSGVDFGTDPNAPFDYNIRYLHNIDINTVALVCHSTLNSDGGEHVLGSVIEEGIPNTIEDDITIEQDYFYGDVVEFNKYYYTETEISPVFFRFNTAQREYVSSLYRAFFHEKFKSDDYDLTEMGSLKGFKTDENDNTFSTTVKDGNIYNTPGNLCPEGYFYNPHTKIALRENADGVKRIRAKKINYINLVADYNITKQNETTVNITVPTSYGFINNDHIAFCDKGGVSEGVAYNSRVIWGTVTSVNGTRLTISFEGNPFNSDFSLIDPRAAGTSRRFEAYYCEEAVPLYAAFNSSMSSFVWKEFSKPSEMRQDMELYDTPFSNGRFYIEKNITFFLKRQDPYGDFGLLYARLDEDDMKNRMEYFRMDGQYLDLSQVYGFYNNINNICY